MEEMINKKIESLIGYIVNKPNETITMEDYNILTAELRDIRFRKAQEENGDKFRKLMELAFPNANGFTHLD